MLVFGKLTQIMHTGTARVSTYFKVSEDAKSGLRTSAFRGRKLVGRVAQLPVVNVPPAAETEDAATKELRALCASY